MYEKDKYCLFTYGVLKKGARWHHLLQDAKYICDAYTLRRYPLIINSYPYLLQQPGYGLQVHGEVYEINYRILRRIDAFELHPGWFTRSMETVKTTGNEMLLTWMYFLNISRYDQLGGDWKELPYHNVWGMSKRKELKTS